MVQNFLLNAVEPTTQDTFVQLLPMLGVMALLFFFMNRSNKKKEKEAQDLRASLEVGDEIVTVGGIVGRVVKLEEDTLLVESGSDRTKIRFKREAIGTNNSAIERKDAEKEAAMAAKGVKKK